MSRYKIYTSGDGIDMFDAAIKGDEARMKEIGDRIHKKMIDGHNKKIPHFISLYGEESYNFNRLLQGIIGNYADTFLYTISEPYILTYNLGEDEENGEYTDNSYTLWFSQGKFQLHYLIAGGYAGQEVIANNLSQEEVMSLITPYYVEKKSIKEIIEAIKSRNETIKENTIKENK